MNILFKLSLPDFGLILRYNKIIQAISINKERGDLIKAQSRFAAQANRLLKYSGFVLYNGSIYKNKDEKKVAASVLKPFKLLDYYCDGYWQTEKWFVFLRSKVLEQFAFPYRLLSREANQYLKEINQSESVSIHIRRGDYLSNSESYAYHGVLSIEYYHQAIKRICSKINNQVKFFVFSDDVLWCKDNLHTVAKNIVFVEHARSVPSWVDMSLMAQCKHNVIANSSYSWWGAWLNQNQNKTVIAPQQWTKINNHHYSNIYCKDWVILQK